MGYCAEATAHIGIVIKVKDLRHMLILREEENKEIGRCFDDFSYSEQLTNFVEQINTEFEISMNIHDITPYDTYNDTNNTPFMHTICISDLCTQVESWGYNQSVQMYSAIPLSEPYEEAFNTLVRRLQLNPSDYPLQLIVSLHGG